MKRYFKIEGRQQVLILNLSPPVCSSPVAELSKQLKLPLIELDKSEYQRLAIQYGKENKRG